MSTDAVAREAAVADPLARNKPVAAVKKVCAHCGRDDVGNDAAVKWDVPTQSWVVGTVYDCAAFCDECDGETELRDVPVELIISTPVVFSAVRLAEYVASHGFGEPLVEAFDVGRALFDQGDDYATVAAEIVTRGLTTQAEGRVRPFTVFVQQADGRGRVHISAQSALNEDDASVAALAEAAADWNTADSELEVLGVAMGDVEIVSWNG